MNRNPPAHLYLHVPFCVRACDYCAFYKETGADSSQRQGWLDCVARDAARLLPPTSPLQSVYIGGGTPSFLSTEEWQQLLDTLHRHATLATGCEFTVEVNPVSMSAEKVRLLKDAGVTRISIGLQSFSDRLRQQIGRAGTADRIHGLIERLREERLASISCDLIFGIPGQSLEEWVDDLQRVVTLAPDHVSAYSLMLEAGTPLAKRMTHEGDDETIVTMWHTANELLGTLGLERYEVSNLAKPGHACRHNDAVWHGAPFVGLGPSASWYDGETRYTNVANLERWMAGEPPERDWLPPEARAVEILANGLRTTRGWTPAEFHLATGYDYCELREPTLRHFAEAGLIEMGSDSLRPTTRGLLFADYMARELY